MKSIRACGCGSCDNYGSPEYTWLEVALSLDFSSLWSRLILAIPWLHTTMEPIGSMSRRSPLRLNACHVGFDAREAVSRPKCSGWLDVSHRTVPHARPDDKSVSISNRLTVELQRNRDM